MFIGEIIGILIGGYLGDKYGRRLIINYGLLFNLFFGIISVFS
jgi:MFS family permease